MTDFEYLCGIKINDIILNLFSIYEKHPDIELNPGKYLGLGPDSHDSRIVDFTFSSNLINLKIRLTDFDDPFIISFKQGNCFSFDICNIFPYFNELTFSDLFKCDVNIELGKYIEWVIIIRKKFYSLYSNLESWENDGKLGTLFDEYRSCFVFNDTQISNRFALFINLWEMYSFLGFEFSRDPENFVKWYLCNYSAGAICPSYYTFLWDRPDKVLERDIPILSNNDNYLCIKFLKIPLKRFKDILSMYREYYVTNDLVILNLCEKYGLSYDNNSFLDYFSSSKILSNSYSREDDRLVLSLDLLKNISNSNE